MSFDHLLRQARGPLLSFEFFPPRNGPGEFAAVFETLKEFRPDFVSATCGAGGSGQETTLPFVESLTKQHPDLPVVPHLTCAGRTRGEMEAVLDRYEAAGVRNFLALRGDPPADGGLVPRGDFPQAADLVSWLRDRPSGASFGIGVGGFPEGHPSTPNRLAEMDYLKAKVDAGADYICTQLFFGNGDFYDFRERCELAGIRVPILAGILPLSSEAQMHRMASLAGRMRYPAPLLRALRRANGDAETFRLIALHHAIQQCHDLLNHETAGLHFYTLNRAEPAGSVLRSLGFARKGSPTRVA